MHIFTRIGVFRLLGTAFGTTVWHELSLISGRKHQFDQCDGEGDDSIAKEQEYTKKTFMRRTEGRGSTDTLIRTRIIYRDSLFCLFLRSMMGWVAS